MSIERAPVFEETYQHYLTEIGRINYLLKAEILGVGRSDDSLLIPLYNKKYTVSPRGIYDISGKRTNPAAQVILGKYVLTCQKYSLPEPDNLKNYRDFRGSAPLHSYFRSNSTVPIESVFTGDVEGLKERSLLVGGEEVKTDSYDFSALFYALPRIPVLLNYNDRDDLFPAACSVLYRDSAEQFLDMECLAMTGVLLAEKLIGSKDS